MNNNGNSHKVLPPELEIIARHKGTEPPFSGKYVHEKRPGTYECAVCGTPLFDSETKFDSGSGWPSFYAPSSEGAVKQHEDAAHGMRRTEVTCANCQAHLGHVFEDGPCDKTGLRYCINSISLSLKAK